VYQLGQGLTAAALFCPLRLACAEFRVLYSVKSQSHSCDRGHPLFLGNIVRGRRSDKTAESSFAASGDDRLGISVIECGKRRRLCSARLVQVNTEESQRIIDSASSRNFGSTVESERKCVT
jgi:hypothetical protein